jgi:hypothetical protein
MAIRHLPVVGRPTSTPTLLGKIAIDKIAVEEYFVYLAHRSTPQHLSPSARESVL